MAIDRPRRGSPAHPAHPALPAIIAPGTVLAALLAMAVTAPAAGTAAQAVQTVEAVESAGGAAPSAGGAAQTMAVSSKQPDRALDPPPLRQQRQQMVEQQIKARGVTSAPVLAAMVQVPRHLFVPVSERGQAYEDHPLAIGSGQTISQPYVVAVMTALLDLPPHGKVLEVGTGSGYQAAVLSRVAGEVYSIEIVPALAARARETLSRLGYGNVQVRVGDGYRGWPEAAPFDGILITAAPQAVPPPLVAQLKPGGRMVLPVGGFDQNLTVLTKNPDGTVKQEQVLPVRFVPMTGEAERH
jgi:protein-L-isoaspartate(D-aspartate) O-methyltransferase